MNLLSKKFSFTLFGLILASLLIVACSKDTPEAQAKAASKTTYDILEYVPADSPYFMGGLEMTPKKLRDKFSKMYSEIGDAYWEFVQVAIDSDESELEDILGSDNPWVKAIVAEFYVDDKIKDGVMKEFGLSLKSTGALYGNGLVPVLRIKLEDAKRLEKTIKRIEKRAEQEIPNVKIDNNTVWTLQSKKGDAQVMFSIDNDYFVASFAPSNVDDAAKKQLLGFDKPKQSLASSQYLNKIMQDKNYLPYGIGFIDFEKMSRPFIEGPTGLNKVFLENSNNSAMPHEAMSEVCKKEIKQLINVAPRLLIGATKYDTDDMNLEYLLEVRPDLAKEMSNLTAPVPGLGEAKGLFSMGFSFNLENIQKFGLKQINAVKENPYQCEKFDNLNSSLGTLEAQLSNPAVGFMQGLRGMNFVVDDFDKNIFSKVLGPDMDSLSEADKQEIFIESMQKDMGGYVLLSVDNSENLYNLAKMFSPEIASLGLEPNGKAKLINDAIPVPIPFDVYATMADQAFVVTAGKNADNKAKKVTALEATGNAPLVSYSMDYDLYRDAMKSVFDNIPESEGMSTKESKALQKLMTTSLEYFDKAALNLRLREDGIAFEYDIELN